MNKINFKKVTKIILIGVSICGIASIFTISNNRANAIENNITTNGIIEEFRNKIIVDHKKEYLYELVNHGFINQKQENSFNFTFYKFGDLEITNLNKNDIIKIYESLKDYFYTEFVTYINSENNGDIIKHNFSNGSYALFNEKENKYSFYAKEIGLIPIEVNNKEDIEIIIYNYLVANGFIKDMDEKEYNETEIDSKKTYDDDLTYFEDHEKDNTFYHSNGFFIKGEKETNILEREFNLIA